MVVYCTCTVVYWTLLVIAVCTASHQQQTQYCMRILDQLASEETLSFPLVSLGQGEGPHLHKPE